MEFDDKPFLGGQAEYIKPLTQGLGFNSATDLIMFYKNIGGIASGSCTGNLFEPECISQFSSDLLEEKHKYFYGGMGHAYKYNTLSFLDGLDAYVFAVMISFETGHLTIKAVSNLEKIEFRKNNFTSPLATYDPIFMSSMPALPQKDMSLEKNGDVFVSNGTYGPMGNDLTGNGTKSAPYLTVDRARQHIIQNYPQGPAGVTLFIRGGHYKNQRGSLVGKYDLNFNSGNINGYQWRGGAGNRFKVRGYPTDPDMPTFDNYKVDPAQYFNKNNVTPPGYWSPKFWFKENVLGGYYGADLASTEYLTLEGVRILGASVEGINLDNGRNVSVRFNEVGNSGKWGLQAFGAGVRDLNIEGNKFIGTFGEHGIYIAGGIWEAPYVSTNIVINGNYSAYNGRTGIQVNGTHKNVKIINNKVFRNVLGGVTTTGTSNVVIKNNLIAENLQQPIIAAFSYVDETYYASSCLTAASCPIAYKKGMDEWLLGHLRVMTNYDISYNTLVVRGTSWDSGTTHALSGFEGIKIPEDAGFSTGINEYSVYPAQNIKIKNNIIKTVGNNTLSTAVKGHLDKNRAFAAIDGIEFKSNLVSGSGDVSFCSPYQLPYCNGLTGRPSLGIMESEYPATFAENILNTWAGFKNFAPVQVAPSYVDGVADMFSYDMNNPIQSDYGVNNSSPAVGVGENCPMYDLEGNPRSMGSCTLGAFE